MRRRFVGWRQVSWIATLALVVGACSDDTADEPRDAAADSGEPALRDRTAGKACKRDSDCKPGRCERELAIAAGAEAMPAPGGYCTLECTSDTQCGERGECAVPAGKDRGQCLGQCRSADDCREGYVCAGATQLQGAAVFGNCQPKQQTGRLASGAVGRGCVSDADCAGGRCAAASPLGPPFPGNYCTARCYSDDSCGTGGACLSFPNSVDAGHCFERCTADADCTRDGYRCVELQAGFSACYPAPQALPDHTAGKPCDSDAACGGTAKSCASELPYGTFSAYESVPAPGGYCTQQCSLDSQCGAGAQCISRGVQGGMCLATCNEAADCREGYWCITHGRANRFDEKVCVVPLESSLH